MRQVHCAMCMHIVTVNVMLFSDDHLMGKMHVGYARLKENTQLNKCYQLDSLWLEG